MATRSKPTKLDVRALIRKEAEKESEKKIAAKQKREATKLAEMAERVNDVQAAEQARQAREAARRAKEAEVALDAHWIDFAALTGITSSRQEWELTGQSESFVAYLAEQGIAPDGSTIDANAKVKKPRYDGPMLTLVSARVTYVKGENGNPHSNDNLARVLQSLSREQICTLLIRVMKLESNPYAHLNPGQQSMNLRNKARAQIKAGLITLADIETAILEN